MRMMSNIYDILCQIFMIKMRRLMEIVLSLGKNSTKTNLQEHVVLLISQSISAEFLNIFP